MNVKLLRSRMLLLLALTTYGCATQSGDISENYSLSNNEGVVVLSLTSAGECGYALFADVRSLSSDYETNIGLQSMFQERDWQRKGATCSLDDGEYDGVLRVISLPNGDYEIFKLSGIGRYSAFDTSNDFSIRFSVHGGQVSYLGNLHFFIEKDTFNYSIIDSSERDFDVFFEKYPTLKGNYKKVILQDGKSLQ